MRCLLAKNEMSESDLVSVLALGNVDPLGRSGLSADAAIRRMHTNLAHASVPDMQRMLMAARAPQLILDALKRFSCSQCDAMTAPKIPRGVSVLQTVAPLRYVAMDVKWLLGWEEDVRIKSVNIVDEASNLQHTYPFFETETSEVLLRQHRQWTRAYGRPRWLKVDASRTNLVETLQRALDADGTQLLDVLREAHEQVGRVEVHGRYFEDMLARVLAQIRSSSRAEWLECNHHQTMEAQKSLTRRCGYSPFQIAIGRDPELPGDLLQDLPNVISSSSTLHDDVAAHAARVRSSARLAVMQFNDNLATRRALDQRPRPLREFSVGDEVAVWRRGTGKGALGKQQRAQWRGPGIILGAVRGNYFVAMPGSVIKAAPEQLRHRTAEEQETDRVALRDLRRAADVLRESGSARNFEDITEQDWPDGDLNSTAEDMEPNQETSENQLPSRRLMRKTPPQEPTRSIRIHGLSMSDKHQLTPHYSQQWNWKQHFFCQR